ncbi:hypothetical protein EVAR_7109_1 [Eumeta japonica]|uniref:Uncharacterized protein n=1 Tax=Eumeta variegata TaxID=151549 RepID=A0A4C1U7S7_EUMVA|nr:hypothetical protein EVAR_7109_1 [Eumeta japonica]
MAADVDNWGQGIPFPCIREADMSHLGTGRSAGAVVNPIGIHDLLHVLCRKDYDLEHITYMIYAVWAQRFISQCPAVGAGRKMAGGAASAHYRESARYLRTRMTETAA